MKPSEAVALYEQRERPLDPTALLCRVQVLSLRQALRISACGALLFKGVGCGTYTLSALCRIADRQ
jgi:hypothetical protein